MKAQEITLENVREFLASLNVKIDIFGMVFADRERCQDTMRMLGINERVAQEIIKELDCYKT